jgi:hypothetical protein
MQENKQIRVGIIGAGSPGRVAARSLKGAKIGAGIVVPMEEKPKTLLDQLTEDFSDLLLMQKKANINDEYLGKRLAVEKKLLEHAESLQKTRRGRRHLKAVTGRKLGDTIKKAFTIKSK